MNPFYELILYLFVFAALLFMGIIAVKYSTSVKSITDIKDNWIVRERVTIALCSL